MQDKTPPERQLSKVTKIPDIQPSVALKACGCREEDRGNPGSTSAAGRCLHLAAARLTRTVALA